MEIQEIKKYQIRLTRKEIYLINDILVDYWNAQEDTMCDCYEGVVYVTGIINKKAEFLIANKPTYFEPIELDTWAIQNLEYVLSKYTEDANVSAIQGYLLGFLKSEKVEPYKKKDLCCMS